MVLHLGDNKWMIVDSCCVPNKKEPVALNYLNMLGIDPSKSVKIFIVTHWHSDHIRGALQIVKTCKSARFGYPLALMTEEFLTLVSAYSGENPTRLIDRKTCGTSEFGDIVGLLRKRFIEQPSCKELVLTSISADRILFDLNNSQCKTKVRSLSPSDKAYHQSLQQFASLIPGVMSFPKVISPPTQNLNSVALWVEFNDTNLLLGGDLVVKKDQAVGWMAILNSAVRPQGKASIFKVPHHGSETAHAPQVWSEMLDKHPVSILTSKIGGMNSIPKQTDLQRIKALSSETLCTKVPAVKKNRREKTVEKMFKSVVKKRTILGGEIGHIQIRFNNKSNIKTNWCYPAVKI